MYQCTYSWLLANKYILAAAAHIPLYLCLHFFLGRYCWAYTTVSLHEGIRHISATCFSSVKLLIRETLLLWCASSLTLVIILFYISGFI